MACHVIRLLTATECGACARGLPPGYAVITDLIEDPVYVAVCDGCTSGLDGAPVARQLLAAVRVARSGRRPAESPAPGTGHLSGSDL